MSEHYHRAICQDPAKVALASITYGFNFKLHPYLKWVCDRVLTHMSRPPAKGVGTRTNARFP